MKIAITSKNEIYNKIESIISNHSSLEWELIHFTNINQYKALSSNAPIDIIILDLTDTSNIDIYSKIIELNPNQGFIFITPIRETSAIFT